MVNSALGFAQSTAWTELWILEYFVMSGVFPDAELLVRARFPARAYSFPPANLCAFECFSLYVQCSLDPAYVERLPNISFLGVDPLSTLTADSLSKVGA